MSERLGFTVPAEARFVRVVKHGILPDGGIHRSPVFTEAEHGGIGIGIDPGFRREFRQFPDVGNVCLSCRPEDLRNFKAIPDQGERQFKGVAVQPFPDGNFCPN